MEIAVRQMSGLGNQIFQYAAGLYYATKYNAGLRVLIDPAKNTDSFGSPRPFQLAAFQISAPMRKPSVFEQLLCIHHGRAEPVAAAARRLVNAQLWREPVERFFYPELPYAKMPATVYMRAYSEAAGYSTAVEAQLRKELQFRDGPGEKDDQVLKAIAASRCPVSVHLRRGDFLVGSGHALRLDYYEKAWKLVLEEFADVEFFIFSDDIDFAREHLPRTGPRHFISHNDGLTAYQDLRLMSACRHHIIANSSFSWWGAWLNPDPAKAVFAPKYWRNFTESYFPDLFPAGWRLLDNRDPAAQ